jgi:hypothetical protein
MTDFDSLTEGLLINNEEAAGGDCKTKKDIEIENPFETKTEPPPQPVIVKAQPIIQTPTQPNNSTFFDTREFQKELRTKSIKKNKSYQLYSENITAYDIASGCARSVFYRINNVPTNNYANKWLPVELRCVMGQGVHDFIQDNCATFTEQEVCLKVPSKRLSTRLDCLINNDVLVEIKSCNYADLKDIIKTQKPRIKDFYQAALYKYLLENYLDEIKQQKPTRGGTIPLLDNYDIKHLQFIYVCHELVASDTDSMSAAVKDAKNLRKLSNSKKNPFWFIQTMNVDLQTVNMPVFENIIKEKIDDILYHLNNNKIPEMDNKFVDKGACFFCIHGKVCESQG